MAWEGIDPSKWAAEQEGSIDDNIRGVAIAYFSEIIYSSPVDEGTFRSNWFATFQSPSNKITTSVRGDSAVINAMTSEVLKAPTANQFILTNNLPYATVIEYGGYKGSGANTVNGYSKQAPQGVVRIAATRFDSLLKKEVRKN
jgi:hypothetical protein